MSVVSAQQPPVYKTGRLTTADLPVSRDRYSHRHQNSSHRIPAGYRVPKAWTIPILRGIGFFPGTAVPPTHAGDRQRVQQRLPLHFQTGNGAGLGSLCSIAEQPVLSTKGKGADGVLCQVVGDRNLAIAQKCRKLLLSVQAVAHRFFQLAALFWVDCF